MFKLIRKREFFLPCVCTLAIAIAAIMLYLPYLKNGLIFDDHNGFTNLAVYDAAQTPFSLSPRTFPNFTLGFVAVQFGSIEAQRIVSLILHILCSGMLFLLLKTLLRQALESGASPNRQDERFDTQSSIFALIVACWFAINPVAVYGAGYLIERTILFATLFSLMSLWFFCRAFRENRLPDVITAALLYSLAVLSKEHAVLLPLAAIPLVMLYPDGLRSKSFRIVLFLLLCIPAGAKAVFAAKSVIGSAYEPYVDEVISQMGAIAPGHPLGSWFVSAVLQMQNFFQYLYYWLIPDVRSISIDMRVDFLAAWQSPWLPVFSMLFVISPLIALYCLLRRGRWALFGCGLLYSWFLFMTELATIRFQEPFVLYRSFLWAPGFAMMLMAPLSRLPWKPVLTGFALVAPVLFNLAQDRLNSMVSERTVWEDAAQKLRAPDLPGADRIYFNRGGELVKRGQLDAAMVDLDRVVAMNPNAFHGYLGRGMIYLAKGDNARALVELDRVVATRPSFGAALYRRGLALEGLGRMPEALDAYAKADKAGEGFARLRINYLRKSAP